MVFQYPEYQLFAQTVEKDVGFGLKYSRLSREEKQERVRWALEQMGFSYEEIKDQSPLSLSGGEKRRVAIAGVLATKPELLMLDEPLAGLDPMAREMFLEFLEGLTGQGVSVVMAVSYTHLDVYKRQDVFSANLLLSNINRLYNSGTRYLQPVPVFFLLYTKIRLCASRMLFLCILLSFP